MRRICKTDEIKETDEIKKLKKKTKKKQTKKTIVPTIVLFEQITSLWKRFFFFLFIFFYQKETKKWQSCRALLYIGSL